MDEDKVKALELADMYGQYAPLKKLFDNYPESRANYWAVVDFNLSSSKERLFIFNLKTMLVRKFLVAHGSGSGVEYATKFSNIEGSHCSSLGVYKTLETYNGNHGLSLRIAGLDTTNSNAQKRYIVIHKAGYVESDYKGTGRAGRSEGCFAVNPKHIDEVIENLKGGSYLIAWHS